MPPSSSELTTHLHCASKSLYDETSSAFPYEVQVLVVVGQHIQRSYSVHLHISLRMKVEGQILVHNPCDTYPPLRSIPMCIDHDHECHRLLGEDLFPLHLLGPMRET